MLMWTRRNGSITFELLMQIKADDVTYEVRVNARIGAILENAAKAELRTNSLVVRTG